MNTRCLFVVFSLIVSLFGNVFQGGIILDMKSEKKNNESEININVDEAFSTGFEEGYTTAEEGTQYMIKNGSIIVGEDINGNPLSLAQLKAKAETDSFLVELYKGIASQFGADLTDS